eukprot:761075-Hanusia_phi.AAC.1
MNRVDWTARDDMDTRSEWCNLLGSAKVPRLERKRGDMLIVRGAIVSIAAVTVAAALMISTWSARVPTVLQSSSDVAKELLKADQDLAKARMMSNTATAQSRSQSRFHKLGFVSGDRNGNHHVYNDLGYGDHRRENWIERHYGDGYWIDPRTGKQQYICDGVDDPERFRPLPTDDDGFYRKWFFDWVQTGTHRREYVDDPWCDDQYYGYHFPVHYHDDREVYSNGYGKHFGDHYGFGPQDHYGEFFHGLSPGYDWVEEHGQENANDQLLGYAYPDEENHVIGDEGSARYRPLHYMDWDSDGTRAIDTANSYGEEDFLNGATAKHPRGSGLSKQLLAALHFTRGRAQMARKHANAKRIRSLEQELHKDQQQIAALRAAKARGIESKKASHGGATTQTRLARPEGTFASNPLDMAVNNVESLVSGRPVVPAAHHQKSAQSLHKEDEASKTRVRTHKMTKKEFEIRVADQVARDAMKTKDVQARIKLLGAAKAQYEEAVQGEAKQSHQVKQTKKHVNPVVAAEKLNAVQEDLRKVAASIQRQVEKKVQSAEDVKQAVDKYLKPLA